VVKILCFYLLSNQSYVILGIVLGAM